MALVFFSTLTTQRLMAQSGYQEGFLLTSSLDTVRGLIRFSNKAETPAPCLFKTDKKATISAYEPGSIHGFCTSNGAYFFSRSIGRTSDVYLEVLVRGYMNLFKFGSIYFIEKGDSAFFELSDEIEVLMVEGERQQKRSSNYNRMLSLLTADCLEAYKMAPTVPLKDKQLVQLVTTYNRCHGSESQLFRLRTK